MLSKKLKEMLLYKGTLGDLTHQHRTQTYKSPVCVIQSEERLQMIKTKAYRLTVSATVLTCIVTLIYTDVHEEHVTRII